MRDRSASTWTPGATKLTEADRQTITELWTAGKATQQQLARMYGVAQSLIHAIAKRAGATRINAPAEIRPCAQCGISVQVCGPRKNTRKTFCSKPCYWKHLHNPEYQRSVYGTRLARRKVQEYFNLSEFNVVHHVDFNDNNNQISNLWVFKDSGDHTSYHRGGPAQPIWKGSDAAK
jgi:hypothetical protein